MSSTGATGVESTDAPAAGTEHSTAPDASGARRRTRSRTRAGRAVVWAGVLVLAVVLLAAVGLLRPPPRGAYDPESPARAGTQALARVLQAHGVDVDVRRSIGSFDDATFDASTTVVIVTPDALSPANAAQAYAAAARAARVVLVAPSSATLRSMRVPAQATVHWSTTPVRAGCDSSIARPTDTMQRGIHAYRPTDPASGGWTRCFTEGAIKGSAPLLTRDDGSGHELVLLGYRENMTNELIAQDDNAAVLVRALGHSPRLVWYVPGAADLADAAVAKDRGIGWPEWFRPLVWLLGTSVVLLALVRGRRLGRVVPEPLPVVVRAVETTENRGRLYRRAADHRRTGSVLQAGTRHRLGHRFGVREQAPVEVLVRAVCSATGRPAQEIHRLLTEPVHDDPSLLRLAQQLSDLEEQVRSS